MALHIDWTTVIASAVVASIVGGTQFVFNYYLGRILKSIDRTLKIENKDKP